MKWTNSLPKFTQEETGNPKRPIYIFKIDSTINNLPKWKSPGPVVFTAEFYQTLEEEIIPVPSNIYQKTQAKGILYNLVYETNITLVTRPGKSITRKDNYRPVSLMNIGIKLLNKILEN